MLAVRAAHKSLTGGGWGRGLSALLKVGVCVGPGRAAAAEEAQARRARRPPRPAADGRASDRAGQYRAGQYRAGQYRAGQYRAGRGGTGAGTGEWLAKCSSAPGHDASAESHLAVGTSGQGDYIPDESGQVIARTHKLPEGA